MLGRVEVNQEVVNSLGSEGAVLPWDLQIVMREFNHLKCIHSFFFLFYDVMWYGDVRC